MSVQAGRRFRAVTGDLLPSWRVAPFRAPCGPCKWRQQDEIRDRHDGVADKAGEHRGCAQVTVPQTTCAGTPHVAALRLGGKTAELLVAVVHMEDFIAQDFL